MVRAAKQFFVVRIDKKQQIEKRNNLVNKNFGYLGVRHSEQEGDEALNGVRVWDAEPDSPAYNANLKHNDIIKFINDIPVTTYEQLSVAISNFPPGTEIEVKYINSLSIVEGLTTKKITLGERQYQIVLPPSSIDFQFNLQFGEILYIGDIANKQFPEANVGDILLFHHAVEGKPRTEGDTMYNDHHLLETLENGDEIRIVNFAHELFGVWKMETGSIVPYKNFIFCSQHIRKSSFQMSNGIWLPDAWEETAEDLQYKIDKLKEEKEVVAAATILKERTTEANYKRKEEIGKRLRDIQRESLALTQQMNQKKLVELTVLYINPITVAELAEDIKPGSIVISEYTLLYPLDIHGMQYTLLRKDYVEAVIVN